MDAILTFHAIGDGASPLLYPAPALEQLLEGLLEDGVRIVPLAEVAGASPASTPRLAITFDDGLVSVHEQALPLLQRLGLPATVFVVSGFVGRDNRWPSQPADAPRLELLDWSRLAELRDAGFEIGDHSASHPRMQGLSGAELDLETAASKERIEQELQVPVHRFAWPYGVFDDDALEAVRPRYQAAVTTRMRFCRAREDPLRLPRIDACYLRRPRRLGSLFGPRARAWLGLRAQLRRLRSRVAGP